MQAGFVPGKEDNDGRRKTDRNDSAFLMSD